MTLKLKTINITKKYLGKCVFKMSLTLIAAISENNVIGKDGKIPWGNIPEDMKRFKELTMGHPVIMGRKTYESIPEKFRPLSGRENFVFSRTLKRSRGVYIIKDFVDVLDFAMKKESYVVGGEQIYEMFLPWVNKIELTRIHRNYDGDVSFPEIDWGVWRLTNEEKRKQEDGLEYSFLTYGLSFDREITKFKTK